jgi:hypothetical protein
MKMTDEEKKKAQKGYMKKYLTTEKGKKARTRSQLKYWSKMVADLLEKMK